ncbi:Regulator of Vps4 activity in the MVB pathway protein [Perilla frutescens var. hirtella]|nr:Regulator of Vps4 activity in the MVB pathway protein [Perilla frutescens var. hirtella]
MSMLDSFFKQRFNAAKCKTLLKLTIPRIKLLRNRREVQLKQMRKEIAKLLETGQEATARIRVEHIIREEKMMAAQEIVELFCELIAVRLPIIEAQRECPLDLKEAISSVCFAAPRCADLTELLQVQILFAGKYGKEFVIAATELMPECGVNRQLVELLSIRAPAPDAKLKLLKEIAEEYQLDWDSSATENELLKPHEDLLNGPTQFVSGSKLPLPKEKHDETTYTASEPTSATHEKSDSDSDFDIVDFPEVPTQPLQPNKTTVSTPVMLHFPESALSDDDNDQEEPNRLEPEDLVREKSVAKEDAPLNIQSGPVEAKQFLPFMNPPQPQSSETVTVREHNSPPVISKIQDDVDLQDVLAAARAAAESAERAAAAARSAASIAQLRISGLSKRRSNEFSVPNDQQHNDTKTGLDKQNSNGDSGNASTSPSQIDGCENHSTHQPMPASSFNSSSPHGNEISPDTAHHQPQRLPSMDDETYFSYPNLFTTQGSNVSVHSQSPRESK